MWIKIDYFPENNAVVRQGEQGTVMRDALYVIRSTRSCSKRLSLSDRSGILALYRPHDSNIKNNQT